MQVSKWGNSLAVRLPAKLVQQLGLKEGDEVEIVASDNGLVITRTPDRLELLAALRKFRGMMPGDHRCNLRSASRATPKGGRLLGKADLLQESQVV